MKRNASLALFCALTFACCLSPCAIMAQGSTTERQPKTPSEAVKLLEESLEQAMQSGKLDSYVEEEKRLATGYSKALGGTRWTGQELLRAKGK